MVFVGGVLGMAPMRSPTIFDQLKRSELQSKITFWYGAS